MVTCLLLTLAALLWPLAGAVDRLPAVRGGVRRRAGHPLTGPAGRARTRTVRLAAAGVLLLGWLLAGLMGALTLAMVVGTATWLLRRAIVQRRHRRDLLEIVSGLRMLGRELQAGAEPAVAAANASSAASGAGAAVLSELAQLTRSDDRPGTSSGPLSGPHLDRRVSEVVGRLRSGWLLTRRYGVSFTPLIEALAVDLSERIAADAERAGEVAGPRTSGYVMALLPLLGLALGAGMGADPVRVLIATPVGNALLLVGIGLTSAGLVWSARIVGR